MCRVLGCVAHDPVSLQHELLEAANPLISQSEEHDSGWGMAVYRTADGGEPVCSRFAEAAYAGDGFRAATTQRGRIIAVHVRRATIGGLTAENSHPFCLANFTFAHNGTIVDYARLLEPGVQRPHGDTDSEYFFNFLMRDFDPGAVVDSLRHGVAAVVERSAFSGLNFLFSDGERLYAYRLGSFELHWCSADGKLLVSSERVGDPERWHSVQQDVLLTLDPADLEEPHAERLIGDALLAQARFDDFADGAHLRGSARGAFAAQQAARLAAAADE